MKNLFFIMVLLALAINVHSQSTNTRIYFLADTINVSKENQVLKHGYINFFEYFFTFFCKCAYPYKNEITFSYINKKGEKKAEIVSEKPELKYISYRELMNIVNEYHKIFNDSYDLYITEVMPGNRYRTNKVLFLPYRPPVINLMIVPNKR